MILLAAALATTQPLPTAREAYVGCYLLTQGADVPLGNGKAPPMFSAASCAMILDALAKAEQDRPKGKRTFCLPPGDPPYEKMASAYVDYFERSAPVIADRGAMFEMLKGVALGWPCFDQ